MWTDPQDAQVTKVYYEFNSEYKLDTTVCLKNVKLIHITRMEEPYVDHSCIQIMYDDETTVILFAPSQEFSRDIQKIYKEIVRAMTSATTQCSLKISGVRPKNS